MSLGKLCKAKARSTGRRCGQPAVKGYDVCWKHGAGTRKRVLEGTRKSPRLAPIKTGEHVSPETDRERRKLDPLYAKYLAVVEQHPETCNIDEARKRAYASLLAIEEQRFKNPVDRHFAILSHVRVIVEAERGKAAIKLKEAATLNLLLEAVAQVLKEFVPNERFGEAIGRLRACVGLPRQAGRPASSEPVAIGSPTQG